MTKRYAPWLEKALRVKSETERFWVGGIAPQESSSQRSESSQCQSIEDPEGEISVWDAVETDNAGEVKRMLEKTPALLFQRREGATYTGDGRGLTLVHVAAASGSALVIELLLEKVEAQFQIETLRAFVNSTDSIYSKMTPLIAVCRSAKGLVQSRLKTLQLLVHAGADVEHQDAHGDNAIHWCARTSNHVLLRWLLNGTDAAANAVFAENFKREKPLDIAKRELACAKSNCFSAQNVYNTLRSVDRKCNMRLKMQVIKRHMTNVHNEQVFAFEAQWATALAAADEAIEHSNLLWKETLQKAETNRKDAETAHAVKAGDAARVEAIQWLESKDGKNFVKKQTAVATDELKIEILRGKISKPKDMKKAAAQRACDTYIDQQGEAARKKALDSYRASYPSYALDPERLAAMFQQ